MEELREVVIILIMLLVEIRDNLLVLQIKMTKNLKTQIIETTVLKLTNLI